MKVWELMSQANDYDNFTLCNESDWDKFMEYQFDGRSIKDTWIPFCVEEIETRRKGDKPSLFGTIPVFSRKAIEVLKKYLDNNAEVLPLSYDKGDYFVINVTNVKDCVDYEKAEVVRFKNSDKIMMFDKYAFKPESIKNEHIFKISEYSKVSVLVSNEFKNLVESSGLEGFAFIEVWDSEKDY
ncbi:MULTISPECIES: imm11 family protein [Clostridium]|uniref:imm11 family protein n=1 Tax=Clostridium TaxID=1485 RepID=UPI000E08605D|nr:DUF1629 domain-containing protein [Clostridium sporogenes]EJO5347965.1 hypothetical protein [Clostridium botulinum]MCW6087700.1 hypothetical protein [Clostridium sporogenes]STC72737.1 Uncharacterised protein [Clostridium botulinum]